MPNSEPSGIPKSVMRLLESLEWKDCDPWDGDLAGFMVGYFQGLHREYLIANDCGAAPSRPSLSHAEAVDLMKEGVLRGFARQDRDGAIAINEKCDARLAGILSSHVCGLGQVPKQARNEYLLRFRIE
jgi:hypothetical protein